MDCAIGPVWMGGLVKEAGPETVKVHLHGRLGVLTVKKSLIRGTDAPEPGLDLGFYFSYLQIVEQPWDYDSAAMDPKLEPTPCLLGGVLRSVNDTAVKAEIQEGLGEIAVPRRWVFTNVPLAVGQTAEFYLSSMTVTGKRDIPAAFI